MSGFSGFSVKGRKNPFQKAKELEEEKKKRDDAEAAKVYEEFVKDFGGDDDSGIKAFVRGGTIEPGKPGSGGGPPPRRGAAPSRHYVPSFIPPGMAAAMEKDKGKGTKKEESVFQLPSSNKGKPRSIDVLLENLKREQEEREQRKEAGMPLPNDETRGSFDSGDPGTTNLFIGGLAPDVDEQILMREFGRFGPLGSVKVMWPRDEEQRRRGRNNGFVNFMKREDAERAKDALDGMPLHDLPLAIGWGKQMPLPAVPCYPPPGGLAFPVDAAAAAAPPPTRTVRDSRGIIHERPIDIVPASDVIGIGPTIEVVIPSDPRQRFVIDAVSFYVLRDGSEFEQVLMEQEASNPEFSFLFNVGCPEHAYYRWRVYSLACGDSLRSWRVEPFVMVEGSNKWVPPPMTAGLVHPGDQRTAAQRGEGRREDQPLSDLQRDKLEDMLRTLTVERSDISAAMVFALDNAESAAEVSEVLCDSLCLAETPIPLKVARLFLLSDVLHNSTAPVRNASRYRSRLEDKLPDIFESLQEAYRSCDGRMAQDLLRRNVLRVLRAWRGKYLFSDDVLNGLQATFLRGAGAGGAGNPALESELEALGNDELELKCRRSGLTRRGGRAAQISRLLALDAYLQGDSGTRPRPAERAAAAAAVAAGGAATPGASSGWTEVAANDAPAAPRSKWEEVGPDDAPAAEPAAVSPAPTPAPKAAPEPAAPAAPPAEAVATAVRHDDEARRQRLRQVEVEVMLLREDLEEKGLARAEIDRRAEELRARLLAEDSHVSGRASAGGSSGHGAGSVAPTPSTRDRDRERGRDREREGWKERESKRARSSDRERERERKRSHSAERRRSSRSPRRNRSRSRSRERKRR